LPVPSAELDAVWSGVRDELRRSVTDVTFHLWLEPLEVVASERDLLRIRAPKSIRRLIEERYLGVIRSAAGRRLGRPVAVEVVDREENVPPPGARGTPTGIAEPRLSPRYTFDQFVLGDGNRLAHAAALAVAEQPGQAYNPLFLHGPPGLGKTHLLHAIGNYVTRFGGGLSVRYATSDAFTSGFVTALRAGGIDAFKAAFREVNVLLLDDVQFLADRRRTQEELFHTLDALLAAGCQLVLSSDQPPHEMTSFERRVAERFGAGLVAELGPPGTDVRLAILRKRAALDGVGVLPDETLMEIARLVTSSVRALEGALIRVVAQTSLTGEDPTPDLARRLLSGRERRGAAPQLADVRDAAAAAFGIPIAALVAHDRRPSLSFARQVAMYVARELTGESLPQIGAAFGGRNHSTVLHAHRRIQRGLERDPSIREAVESVRSRLGGTPADRGG
jgi:chromosomal replication initiator protein